MKNKKILKGIKIALIALLTVAVLAAVAGYCVFEFAIKPKSEQILNAVNEIIKDEEILNEIEPYLESEELEAILNQTEVLDQIDEEVSQQVTKPPQTPKEDTAKTGKKTKSTPKPSAEPQKSKEEYNSKMEYIKDNVSNSDFAKGVAYASRVDVKYILGLLSGGLTTAEKKELKAYLKERFTSSEIAEGISLYSKYSHLLK